MIHNICDYSWPLNDHVHQDWATTFATVTMPAENDNSNVLSTIGDRPHTADNSVSLPLKYLYHVIKCVTEFATSSLSICRLVDKVLSGRRPIRFLLVRYRHLALVGNTVCPLALEKTFLKTAYYARFQGKGAFCAILFCVVAFVGVVLFFFFYYHFLLWRLAYKRRGCLWVPCFREVSMPETCCEGEFVVSRSNMLLPL